MNGADGVFNCAAGTVHGRSARMRAISPAGEKMLRPLFNALSVPSTRAAKMSAEEVLSALAEVLDETTLAILERKKQKSGAPEKLVRSLGLVDKCTLRLEGIAIALAHDEYDDYKAIQEEILEAAKAVRAGSGAMTVATKALQAGNDAESAWDGVGAAVGKMVLQCMRMLDIIYGVEVRVLELCSRDAASVLDGLSQLVSEAGPETDDDGVDALLQTARATAAAMKPLCERLKTRGAGEKDAHVKRQLEACADAILERTNAVLQAVNAFAQHPEAPELKMALSKGVEDLQREVGPLAAPLAPLIPRLKKVADDVANEARKLKMGKGKDAPGAPPQKQYRIVRPSQWDPKEEEDRPWPRLRHVDVPDKQVPGWPVPDWARGGGNSSGGAGPTLPRSGGSSTSPRSAVPPGAPLSPGREGYSRQPKESGQPASPRRGWKPGQGAGDAEGPAGRGIRIVPPRQLPFNPADPPMAWPVLRHVEQDGLKTFPRFTFPWVELRPFMASEAVHNALSHIHHALEAGDFDTISDQLKLVSEAAPALGNSANDAVKKELDGFETAARADPAAAQARLKRALQQTSPAPIDGPLVREVRFKPFELLPPAKGAAPFPWPKLRHWAGESVVTLADEVEETLRDWLDRETRKQDAEPCRQCVLAALECLHDELAPKFGSATANVLKSAALEAHKLVSAKSVDFDAVRKALQPLIPESNLPPAWLTALRARNASKREHTPAVAQLYDVVGQIRGALEAAPEASKRRALELLEQIERLTGSKAVNGESLLSASDELVRLLEELLQQQVISSELLRQLTGAAAAAAAKAVPPASSPRGRGLGGFESAATRAAEIVGLKLPPAVKGSKLLTEQSPLVVDTRKIGSALARYAEAAKSNDGRTLIEASKEIAALCRPLSATLAKLPAVEKDIADRISNIVRALSTYPTQMRVLSSVKASSGGSDKHAHEQLVHLVDQIATALGDVVPAVNACILAQK